MVGWHHPLNGHEFEQTLEDSEGQGSLACCNSLGLKESDMTQQNNNEVPDFTCIILFIPNTMSAMQTIFPTLFLLFSHSVVSDCWDPMHYIKFKEVK